MSLTLAQLAREAQAVLAGQHQVEHDRVGRRLRDALVHLLAVDRGVDDEAAGAQVVGQQLAQRRIVVDDEDAWLRGFVHWLQVVSAYCVETR